MFKNMSLGKKIGGGFGVMLVLLAGVAFWSVTGIGKIVGNATEVIDGNKLRGLMVENEVAHLNWAKKVNELLTNDQVTTLDVQLDDHKCTFGKWLYGEGRKKAEGLVAEISPSLKEIEASHAHLHESAAEIKKVFRQASTALPGILAERISDHLKWAMKIRESMNERKDSLGVQVDHSKCGLGTWMNSSQAKDLLGRADNDFKVSWNELIEVHKQLHESAISIEKNLVYSKLRDAQKSEATSHANMADVTGKMFATAENAMENIVDPAKVKAAEAKDVAVLERWSSIDMYMNENILQPMLKCQILVSDLRLHNSQKEQDEVIVALQKIQKNVNEYAELLQKTAMEETGKKIGEEVDAWVKEVNQFMRSAKLEQSLNETVGKAEQVYRENTIPLLQKTLATLSTLKKEAEHELLGMQKANTVYATKTAPALGNVQALLNDIRKVVTDRVMTDQQMLDSASNTNWIVSVVSIVAGLLGICLAVIISKGIITAITPVIAGLRSGGEQVTAASGQVASSSQQMAEGASEQASSLEEISSSLEEMASMTRQNADNAKQANSMSVDASSAAGKGTEAMQRMSSAINEIKKSSDSTAKIIKTIEEIAFQTNLLALNAAVEAARAGDAGKGFAVVAEEVRNLAQRSAEAARNTSEMIEGAQRNADNGVAVTEEVGKALSQISEGIVKVSQLVGEVSAASDEQAQGIDQINSAVAQMDQVTQSNAANAEESASASEELSGQARELDGMVNALVTIVSGAAETATVSGQTASHHAPVRQRANAAPAQVKPATTRQVAKKTAGAVVKPEQVIPLDEEDFGKF